jgi:Putative peptidoglycan binding domain/Papain-like cysteine protease AvrRpt2
MTGPVVRLGSRGPFVSELQTLLNAKLSPSPGLAVSGHFDEATRQAVVRYQTQKWLLPDGIAGDCTFNALRDMETYVILHNVRMVTQPTNTTCWAAATAMVLGRAQIVAAPPFMLNAQGELLNDSELNDAIVTSRFANHFQLRLYPPQTWQPAMLASVLQRGPVMCNVLWNARDYSHGRGSESHWAVFAGIRGDGTASGTTIRLYDPLPPPQGGVTSVNYALLIRNLPALTYQLLQR